MIYFATVITWTQSETRIQQHGRKFGFTFDNPKIVPRNILLR